MSDLSTLIYKSHNLARAASRIYEPAPGLPSTCAETYKLAANPALHPVFRGFLHKQEVHQESKVRKVAHAWKAARTNVNVFSASLVSGLTPSVRKWAKELRTAVMDDSSSGNDSRYWPVSGEELTLANLEQLGEFKHGALNDKDSQKEHDGRFALLDRKLMSVLFSPDKITPIGYCVFSLTWAVSALKQANDLMLDVTIEEVWIQPSYRGRNLSSLLHACIHHALSRSISQVECVSKWGNRAGARFNLRFTSCAPKAAGRMFVEKCKEFSTDYQKRTPEIAVPKKLKLGKTTSEVWGASL